MFKVNVEYKDFLDNDQKDTLRFNISETEMMDLASKDPSFKVDYLRYLMTDGTGIEMVDILRKLIVVSYGELSEDGKKFRKSDERTLDFVQSAAYDKLFDMLVYGDDMEFAKKFLIGIFPAKYAQTITDAANKQQISVVK